MLRHLIAVGAFSLSSAALAETVELSGDTIKATVTGAVMEVDAPFGGKIPVRYSDDGIVSGQAGNFAFFLGSASDRGRWWVEENRLCHKWFRWFDAQPQCITLRQDGNRISWRRDDGETGTATIMSRPELQFAQAPYTLGLPQPPALTKGAVTAAQIPSVGASVAGTNTDKPRQLAPQRQVVARLSDGLKPSPHIKSDAGLHRPGKSQAPAAKTPTSVPKAATESKAPPAGPKTTKVAAIAPLPAPVKGREAGVPSASESALARSFRVARVDADDVLNIRRGPSADDEVVGVILSEGHGVRLAGQCRDEWCPIEHRGVRGWVNSYYLAEEQRPQLSAWPAQTNGKGR